MKTRNFESVLSALATSRLVSSVLELDTTAIDERYDHIQQALVEAVHAVHIPWLMARADVLQAVRLELLRYGYVYSTNYDLLVYWAIMAEPTGKGAGFKDYLWFGQFDLTNTEVWEKATRVLYLHGGLHLYRKPNGETLKRSSEMYNNLLDQFGSPFEDAVPLFVSEGSSADKLASIYRSDYLSFAYSTFARHTGPLVVFGQSLEADAHLVDAMKTWGRRTIAISMRQDAAELVVKRKADLHSQLQRHDLLFFDSSSHPLGADSLRVAHDLSVSY